MLRMVQLKLLERRETDSWWREPREALLGVTELSEEVALTVRSVVLDSRKGIGGSMGGVPG